MEAVISKISDIETAAVSIMDQANASKKTMSQAMALKTEEYDKQMEQATAERLAKLKQDLDADTQKQLAVQKQQAEQALQAMETDYQANHEAYARQILKSLVEE